MYNTFYLYKILWNPMISFYIGEAQQKDLMVFIVFERVLKK